MPLLYPIMAINFTLTFWIDKCLLLRFYKTPINFTGESIRYSVHLMKFSLIFHFLLGYLLITNSEILKDHLEGEKFHLHQFYLTLAIFSGFSTLISWTCSKKVHDSTIIMLNKKGDKVISDDFYNEINLKFVISEYERAQEDKINYEMILFNSSDGTSDYDMNKAKYVDYI